MTSAQAIADPARVRAPGRDVQSPASRGGKADSVRRWFDVHRRDLLWRRPPRNGWRVLVSEVMLQQTGVDRVTPAFADWMRTWPAPADLASEPVAAAVQRWGRLGYPRRAVRLHAAATAITTRHGGEVPRDHGALLGLPGVGTYTAAAVMAFAHRQRIAVLDTNVRRVLARHLEGRALPTPTVRAGERDRIEALLPPDGEAAAVTSEALMELGALVCTARNPRCDRCPLAVDCAWLVAGRPPATEPARRQARYEGSDRQARGAILAALRDADGPLPIRAPVWHHAAQLDRARTSLERDGLLTVTDAWMSLPE